MKEWGWTNPVLADEAGGVIAGHARILAARQLGYAEVPVMIARGWSDAQKRAYVIADNQLALNAGWNTELLGLELGELKLGGFDLALTGFGELELGDLLADRTQGLTDPDDVPEAPERTRLLVPGVGARTVRALAQVASGELPPHSAPDPICSTEPRFRNERSAASACSPIA
jgi:ParB-like chromosome segregation protein Spo0J